MRGCFAWQTSILCFCTLFSFSHLAQAKTKSAAQAAQIQKDVPAASPVPTPASPEAPVVAPTPAPEVSAEPHESRHESSSEREYAGYGKTHGVAGPVTFGPSLTLLGLTRPFAGGLEAKYLDIFGFAAFYGFLPEIKISSVKIKYSSWDVRARWHIFRGAFFVGAAVGKQNLTGSQSQTINGVPVNATLTMDTTFVTPHVGWQWIWKSGFFMGMDLGVQLAMSRSTSLTSDAPATVQADPQYTTLTGNITDKANKIGKIPLPMITFLKVGFLF